MGDIISIYEDYKEVMASNNLTPPTLSNKTIYIYVTPVERKKSAVHKKSAKRRAGKFANPWPLRSKIQHISNIVKRSMLVNESDQYIIPANSEVPKSQIKKFYRRKVTNRDKRLALQKNFSRYNLDLPKMNILKNIEMPTVPSFWHFVDINPDTSLFPTGGYNPSLLPMKKCCNFEMNNMSNKSSKLMAISCGKFRIMLIKSTWETLARDSAKDLPSEGTTLELLKYADLPFCLFCMANKETCVSRDYQSPPRECVGCRLFKDEKGSEDDLIQWTKHSQLVHSQNFGEEKHYDIKSPVSQNSKEGIHLKSKPGSSCCSDSEDGHEKRTIPEERDSFKRRRTEMEKSLKGDDLEEDDTIEHPASKDGTPTTQGSKSQGEDIPNYKKRCATRERQVPSLRSPHTNSDRAIAMAAEQKTNQPEKRIKEIVALREEIAMKLKREEEKKRIEEAKKRRWVRETVITALSEGEGVPQVGIKENIKKSLVSQVDNDNAVIFATLNALSCNNVSDVDDNLTVTTVEKSLRSEETSLGRNSLLKKTVIKFAKNESSAKTVVGTHLTIEDRLRISSSDHSHKLKKIQGEKNGASLTEQFTHLPMLGDITNERSSETIRSSGGRTLSVSGGSDSNSFKRGGRNYARLRRKLSQQKSSRSSTVSNTAVVSKTKMLYRLHINRKPTLIMDLFADQMKENKIDLKSASAENKDIITNVKTKFDYLKSSKERRSFTASSNLKKTPSKSQCRPKSSTNPTTTKSPAASMIPKLRSQKDLAKTSTNLRGRTMERPPSRKPVHISPATSTTSERKLSDNNVERTAKNKYTLRRDSLTRKPPLKSTIATSLLLNQQSQIASLVEEKVSTTPSQASGIRKLSVSTPSSPYSRQISSAKSVPARIEHDNKSKSISVKSTLIERIVEKKIPVFKPLVRPNEGTKVTKSESPTNTQEPKANKGLANDDKDWWKKWNKFSAPNAKAGHPLKSMTLAEFQAKRRANLKEQNSTPPSFINNARLTIMSDKWGTRERENASKSPSNEIKTKSSKENSYIESVFKAEGHSSKVDINQSKLPIKNAKSNNNGQTKNINEIKMESNLLQK
ncbi:uncharacterized protein isoform X2 [Rhodnius prolixus]|uniref:uncharacterized protein isoform X2 n=1 Tax=Rhodnius prolixus TaxID=13249 RepID=UPI003D18F056